MHHQCEESVSQVGAEASSGHTQQVCYSLLLLLMVVMEVVLEVLVVVVVVVVVMVVVVVVWEQQ